MPATAEGARRSGGSNISYFYLTEASERFAVGADSIGRADETERTTSIETNTWLHLASYKSTGLAATPKSIARNYDVRCFTDMNTKRRVSRWKMFNCSQGCAQGRPVILRDFDFPGEYLTRAHCLGWHKTTKLTATKSHDKNPKKNQKTR